LVVPTAIHPAIIKHRQKDLNNSTDVDKNRSSRFPQPNASATNRNRWSSYDIVGNVSVVEEDVDDDQQQQLTDNSTASTSQSQVSEKRNLLAVNSMPVVKARSVETLTHQQQLGYGVDGQSKTVGVEDVLIGAGDDTNSLRSNVSSSSLPCTSTNELTNRRQELLGSLQLVDEKIETVTCHRKKLWAKLLNIPLPEYDVIAELARQSSHRDNDMRELLLTSLIEADRLTSLVSSLLHFRSDVTITVGGLPKTNHAGAMTTSCEAVNPSHEVNTMSISPQQQQPLQSSCNIAPQLTDLSTRLHHQLTSLMNAVDANEKETKRLNDLLTNAQRRIACHTNDAPKTNTCPIAPPGESPEITMTAGTEREQQRSERQYDCDDAPADDQDESKRPEDTSPGEISATADGHSDQIHCCNYATDDGLANTQPCRLETVDEAS
jgi:signal transduction histidine kinase